MSNYHRSIFSLLLIKILIGCNGCYKLNGHSESVWCWRHWAKNYTPGALDFRHVTFGTRNKMPICGTKRAVTMRYMVRSVLKMLLHQIAYIPTLLYDVFGVFLRWTQSIRASFSTRGEMQAGWNVTQRVDTGISCQSGQRSAQNQLPFPDWLPPNTVLLAEISYCKWKITK